jgi:hypothetical protein
MCDEGAVGGQEAMIRGKHTKRSTTMTGSRAYLRLEASEHFHHLLRQLYTQRCRGQGGGRSNRGRRTGEGAAGGRRAHLEGGGFEGEGASGGDGEEEAEVDVHDVPLRVHQQVAVVPVLDLRER